ENRIFVRHGLAQLRSTPLVGLQALLESAKLQEKPALTSADIAYALAPRINAAGRLGCARLAADLLTTPSRERAVGLARFLEEQNLKRQTLERRIFAQARDMAETLDLDRLPALVLASQEWRPGLIGIVAGRLSDWFGRPVLMIALGENGAPGSGSGRSIPGFKLHEALHACD